MQSKSVPPYKPPPQLQTLLDNSKATGDAKPGWRRQTAVLPKRTWIQRNPRLFQITFITTSLLVFFSKPLYDIFLAPEVPVVPGTPVVPGNRR